MSVLGRRDRRRRYKFVEPEGARLANWLAFVDTEWSVSRRQVLEAEFGVWARLAFKLHESRRDVLFHLSALLSTLETVDRAPRAAELLFVAPREGLWPAGSAPPRPDTAASGGGGDSDGRLGSARGDMDDADDEGDDVEPLAADSADDRPGSAEPYDDFIDVEDPEPSTLIDPPPPSAEPSRRSWTAYGRTHLLDRLRPPRRATAKAADATTAASEVADGAALDAAADHTEPEAAIDLEDPSAPPGGHVGGQTSIVSSAK